MSAHQSQSDFQTTADTPWYPLLLEPSFHYRIWGQRDIEFLYPSRPAQPDQVGEVWLTSDDNKIANGPLAGATLGQLCRTSFDAVAGAGSVNLGSFPLLVKFLFTTDKLSVQVHPKDDYARRVENSYGKTEMWHVLRAEPGARLAIGLRGDVTDNERIDREKFRQAIESGKIEGMLNWVDAAQGDTFFVPAGTVHAIGAGFAICEIQQNSDVTYRMYDYKRLDKDGKARQLHVEKSLDVAEFETSGGLTHPAEFGAEYGRRTCLAACSHFATERIEMNREAEFQGLGRFELWILLEGESRFASGGDAIVCKQGNVIVVPASLTSFRVIPQSDCVWMRSYAPDLERDVLSPLRERGYSDSQLNGVCFR